MAVLVGDGLSSRQNLNCAETMLYAANTAYDLGLPGAALKLAAGLGVEGVCGVLSGGTMVFSALFVKERAYESDRVKKLNQEFIGRMEAILGDVRCSHIDSHELKRAERCLPVRRTRNALPAEHIPWIH